MNFTKTDQILKSFSLHEQKAFVAFLQSPYFNSDNTLLKLYRKYYLNEGSGRLNSIKKKTEAASFRYKISALSKHAEYFLMLRHLDKQGTLSATLTVKALAEKKCSKAYDYTFKELHRKSSVKNASEMYWLYDAYETHVNYEATRQSRKLKIDFTNVLHHLDSFYIAKKLQLFCEITNLKNILSGDYPLHLLDEIKKLAVTDDFKKWPVIRIYYLVLLTLTHPENESHFTALQNEVAKNNKQFPARELKEMYQYIKNYCVRKLNSGHTAYVERLFAIYKQMLNDKRLMYHDYLSQYEFKNIVSISLRLHEKEWCRQFIYKHINYLPPPDRKNALTYNLAHLNFSTGNFKIAIRMLRDVEFTDVFYKIDARVILLKCYYELQDEEAYFYQASAFRLFLLRNRQISDYQKRINRNLIIFINKLMRYAHSPAKIKMLKASVLKEKNVADLNWLLEKINMIDK